nr:unnamed protein product [Leishmania braziliensis]
MPKLDAISKGPWRHISQQQRQARQVQRAEPTIGEVPAQSSPMTTQAVTGVRVVEDAHDDENNVERTQEHSHIVNTRSETPQQPHSCLEESHVHSAARLIHRRGRSVLPQPRETLTNWKVAVDGGVAGNDDNRARQGPMQSPSEPTARALEELFNEEQSAEEQQVQQGVSVQRVAQLLSPSSPHQRTNRAEEEDLFSNISTRAYSSTVAFDQAGIATVNASRRTALRQCASDVPPPAPHVTSMAVRAVPHASPGPLWVWLPRRVEALCALTSLGSPQLMRSVADGDRSQDRIRTTPPHRRSSTLFFARGGRGTYSALRDYIGDGDYGLQVALWRRTPCSTPPRTGLTADGANGAPTSLLSSPRWSVTAYEPLSLSLPATALCGNDASQGWVPQQAPVSFTNFSHPSNSVDSNVQRRHSAREDESVAVNAQDDEEAAAVSKCHDHPSLTVMASAHSPAPPVSVATRVYWGTAPPLRGTAPSMLHHGGTTAIDAYDAGSDGAAFAGSRSAGQIIRNSALDQRARYSSVSPADESSSIMATALPSQHQRGGPRGYGSSGARPLRDSATAGFDRDELFCEPPSSPLSATCRQLPAVSGSVACVPIPSMELRITLPWLLHTSTLPPVAAEALVCCLEAHIRAHLPRATAAQGKRNGMCGPRPSGACAPGPALARAQPTPSPREAPPLPSPPPFWVAAFSYTEGLQMYATNQASSLIHAAEDTTGRDAARDSCADPRHDHCGLASAAQLNLIAWPAWVPEAQTSVRLLAALTSGAFTLIETIARALDQATAAAAAPVDTDTAVERGTKARSGGKERHNAGADPHTVRGGAPRSTATHPHGAVTALHEFHVFFEAVFGDAANKRLCRHVRDRLPMHVRDLSELLSRPWCGVARDTVDGNAATTTVTVATAGVWRARCPSILDLVHHLARAWMEECFAGLADRLHEFLITHNPGVVLDLICAHANDSDGAVPHEDLCECARLLKGVCDKVRPENGSVQQRGCASAHHEPHQREHPGCSAPLHAVPQAAQVLPPHAWIYRGIAEFTQGPLQRWERWWWSPSSTPATHTLTAHITVSAAAMQWSTHVNYATVHSLQWVLRHPLVACTTAESVRQCSLTSTAVTDMLALLELLTLLPPLLDTTALLMGEAEAVLGGACAGVMGNAGDGRDGSGGGGGMAITTSSVHSHNAVIASTPAAPSHAATQGFHAYYRVFLGLVCYGAMQLNDAEAMALLSRPQPPPAGVVASTTAPHHHGAASPLSVTCSAQATVDGLWTKYILPLVVGYISGSGAGDTSADRMDALTAADQSIVYTLMLLRLLRLEGHSVRHGSRGGAARAVLPTKGRQGAPNSAASSPSSSRHPRKRPRPAAVGVSGPLPWCNARSAHPGSDDTRPRWWSPSPTTADVHPVTALSPPPGSVSSSAVTADTATTATTTATTHCCVNSDLARINELERVGTAVAEARYSSAPEFGDAPQLRPRHAKSVAHDAASGLVDVLVAVSQEELLAPPQRRIPPLALLAHESAAGGATAATQQCPPSPAPPPEWQGACRQLIRRWLLPPPPRARAQSAVHERSSDSHQTLMNGDCHSRRCREWTPEEGTMLHEEEANHCASVKASYFSGGLPRRPQWLDVGEVSTGNTLHRRDIRRVCGLLAGLALRVADVRQEERIARAETLHSDDVRCCYDYLYGVLPPGLRARDAGLITFASTSSSDDGEDVNTEGSGEDAGTDDDLYDANMLHCSASTISSSSSSRNTIGTSSPPSSSPAASP